MPKHRATFRVAIACISRFLVWRDRILETVGADRGGEVSEVSASRHSIPSAGNQLDAMFVEPAAHSARAAVLICHGIGETIRGWGQVQQLLATHGVASLVFDYSGYGRSSGTADWNQFEQDAVSAFHHVQRLTPELPVSVLGYSMGSGVAAAMFHRVKPANLILGAAFTSFRDAARATGIPATLAAHVPPIWHTRESLQTCSLPVIIIHGEKDAVFPVQMARDLAAACPAHAELIVVPNVGHNQPFRRPHIDYWGLILSRLLAESSAMDPGT